MRRRILLWIAAVALSSGPAAEAAAPKARKDAAKAAAPAAAFRAEVPELSADVRILPDRRIQLGAEVKVISREAATEIPFRLNASFAVSSVEDASGGKASAKARTGGDVLVIVLERPLVPGEVRTIRIQAGQAAAAIEKNPLLQETGDRSYGPLGSGGYLPLPDGGPTRTRYKLRFVAPQPLLVYVGGRLLQRGKEKGAQESWLYQRTEYLAANEAGPDEPTSWESFAPQPSPPLFGYGLYDHLWDDFDWRLPEGTGSEAKRGATSAPPGATDAPVAQPIAIRMQILSPPKETFGGVLSSAKLTAGAPAAAAPAEVWDASDQPKHLLLRMKNAGHLFGLLFGPLPVSHLWIQQTASDLSATSSLGYLRLPLHAAFPADLRSALAGDPFRSAEDWAPHALAHQWFGNLVAFPDPADAWLMEGLAHYAGAFYLENVSKIEGEGAFRDFLKSERARALGAGSLSAPSAAADPATRGARLHAKGAYVIHMLRMMMYGFSSAADEKFLAMLQEFTRTHAGGAATFADFRAIAEKHAGTSLAAFWRQWVEGAAVPKYTVRYWTKKEKDGKHTLRVTCHVRDMDPACPQQLPFIATLPDGRALTGRVPVPVGGKEAKKRFDIPLPAMPKSVEFNPVESILCTFDELRSTQSENEKKQSDQ